MENLTWFPDIFPARQKHRLVQIRAKKIKMNFITTPAMTSNTRCTANEEQGLNSEYTTLKREQKMKVTRLN